MAVRKSEFVPSTNYFVRVKNKQFNYSNNPTFVSDGTDGKTKGTIVYQDLINNPRTYITGVGLYDTNNELIAIGKVSRPVQKNFDSELLLKVRIDFWILTVDKTPIWPKKNSQKNVGVYSHTIVRIRY